VFNFHGFSPLMLIWSLIILNYVESAVKSGYQKVYEKKKHF